MIIPIPRWQNIKKKKEKLISLVSEVRIMIMEPKGR